MKTGGEKYQAIEVSMFDVFFRVNVIRKKYLV